MVVEGDIAFEIDGQPHRLPPGEEVLIPARATHIVRNVGQGESRWLYGYSDDDDVHRGPLETHGQHLPRRSQ